MRFEIFRILAASASVKSFIAVSIFFIAVELLNSLSASKAYATTDHRVMGCFSRIIPNGFYWAFGKNWTASAWG